jgi:hypothetical protein
MFSTNLNDVPAKFKIVNDTINKTIRYTVVNKPIIDMYLDCLDKADFPHSFIILNVKDSNRFIYNKKQYRTEWKKENTFCFESVLPAFMTEEKRKGKMNADLDLYLGLQTKMEKRKEKCFAIVRIDTLSGNAVPALTKGPGKIPVSSLVYILNQNFSGIPVLDETGYTQKFFIQLNENDISDISLLQQTLKKFGLDIITAEREVEMFVIDEIN